MNAYTIERYITDHENRLNAWSDSFQRMAKDLELAEDLLQTQQALILELCSKVKNLEGGGMVFKSILEKSDTGHIKLLRKDFEELKKNIRNV